MKKAIIFSILLGFLVITSLCGCGTTERNNAATNGSEISVSEELTTEETNTIIDYGDEESFEAALNEGKNLEGKIVRFVARELHPQSAFGYDVWSGNHLNFVSTRNPDIQVNDVVTVKATTIQSVMKSWIITYEKVDNAIIGDDTIITTTTIPTTATTTETTTTTTTTESTTTTKETTTKETTTTTTTTTTQATTTKRITTTASDVIDPKFKQMVDSYEAFFNEYAAFMQKYSKSDNALEMLDDYLNYMQKYTDYIQKLDAMDQSKMNSAELAYYLAATARIEKKLLTVVATM